MQGKEVAVFLEENRNWRVNLNDTFERLVNFRSGLFNRRTLLNSNKGQKYFLDYFSGVPDLYD